MPKQQASQATIDEALKIAKGTARPGQTKEQTKIIAQGIEKGITEYKKREKAKARERDKARKKQTDTMSIQPEIASDNHTSSSTAIILPWGLLILSWVVFIAYSLWSR